MKRRKENYEFGEHSQLSAHDATAAAHLQGKTVVYLCERAVVQEHGKAVVQERVVEKRGRDRGRDIVQDRGRAALQGRVHANSTRALAPVTRRSFQILILSAAIFLFLGAGDTGARFRDLGHRMMCACGCKQILLECNHVGCTYSDKMRDQLQAGLDKGDNDDLILQSFVQEYGPTVIAAPGTTGFNRIAWIMPFAMLALGIAFVVWVVRSWKHRPEPALADGIVIKPGRDLDHFRAQARRDTDL